jgi:hypothetical protein
LYFNALARAECSGMLKIEPRSAQRTAKKICKLPLCSRTQIFGALGGIPIVQWKPLISSTSLSRQLNRRPLCRGELPTLSPEFPIPMLNALTFLSESLSAWNMDTTKTKNRMRVGQILSLDPLEEDCGRRAEERKKKKMGGIQHDAECNRSPFSCNVGTRSLQNHQSHVITLRRMMNMRTHTGDDLLDER